MTPMWQALGRLALTKHPGTGPLIGRHAARILARNELDKVSFGERILRDIAGFFGLSASAVPSGWFGLVVLAILVVLLIVIVLAWARPARTRRARVSAVLGGQAMTAREYRRRSRQLADSGDCSAAIIEGVRAIAAELDERGVLSPRVGRTAYELAVEAESELPALAGELRAVTALFDDVRYGDRPGSRAGYELVSKVDASVQAARATVADTPHAVPPGPAVPR